MRAERTGVGGFSCLITSAAAARVRSISVSNWHFIIYLCALADISLTTVSDLFLRLRVRGHFSETLGSVRFGLAVNLN